MPILILSLLGGLLCFYIASDPERIARKASEKAESIPSHQAHGSEDAIEVPGEKDPHPAESPVANPETTSASIIPLANPERGARARG